MIIRFGYLGLGYRTDMLSADDVKSYKILWAPKVKGKVGFFDWYLPSMGCLSLYDGNKAAVRHFRCGLRQAEGDAVLAEAASQPASIRWRTSSPTLTNGTAAIIPGVGDWITLLLQKNGVPVDADGARRRRHSVDGIDVDRAPPRTKKDLAKAFIQYMASPEGQVRSARLPAYWASIPSKAGWELLNEEFPADAKTLRHTFDARNVMDEYKEGKIFIRKHAGQARASRPGTTPGPSSSRLMASHERTLRARRVQHPWRPLCRPRSPCARPFADIGERAGAPGAASLRFWGAPLARCGSSLFFLAPLRLPDRNDLLVGAQFPPDAGLHPGNWSALLGARFFYERLPLHPCARSRDRAARGS